MRTGGLLLAGGLFAAALMAPQQAMAEGGGNDTPAWERKSRDVHENPEAFSGNPQSPVPKGARTPGAKAREQARSVLKNSQKPDLPGKNNDRSVTDAERKTLVFVSFGMGRDRLKDLFEDLGDKNDVVFVIRGMLPETRHLGPTFRTIARLTRQVSTEPNLILDPTKFRKYGIDTVPAVAVVEQGELLGKARGTTGYHAMHRRLERGERGDFGKWGETQAIAEKDLIKVMKKRASALDGDRIKDRIQSSFDNYWAEKGLENIPEVDEPRTRSFRPIYEASRTMKGPKGRTIFKKGQRVNMLRIKNFHKVLIAFDGTESDQIKAVEQVLAETDKPVILTASRVDPDEGWEAYNRIQDRLGERLFRLPPALKRRFRIERLPTVVKAEGNRFVVQEIAP